MSFRHNRLLSTLRPLLPCGRPFRSAIEIMLLRFDCHACRFINTATSFAGGLHEPAMFPIPIDYTQNACINNSKARSGACGGTHQWWPGVIRGMRGFRRLRTGIPIDCASRFRG